MGAVKQALIEVDDRSKPFTYRQPINARKYSAMNPTEAICLELAFSFLNPILPKKTLNPINPYLKDIQNDSYNFACIERYQNDPGKEFIICSPLSPSKRKEAQAKFKSDPSFDAVGYIHRQAAAETGGNPSVPMSQYLSRRPVWALQGPDCRPAKCS